MEKASKKIIVKAADESGLYVQDCFNCFTFDSVNKKSERAQFILRRND